MELIQILVVLGIIFAFVIRQIGNKSANAENEPTTYNPETGNPGPVLPEAWQQLDTLGDDIYNRPAKQSTPPPAQSKTYKKSTAPQVERATYKTSVEEDITDTSAVDNDFNLDSPEELRRAIIWSEILNRKY